MATIDEIDDRITTVEQAIVVLAGVSKTLAEVLLVEQERLEEDRARLEEVRRDSQKTHRLWVNLCLKYGWLDDEDLDESNQG